MQNMLDMYLFESNSLVEQLDGILLEAEQEDSFSEDDINTIFRIMHTLKGSSAMMQFDSLMTVAHRIEDLFFFIRENGMDHEHSRELFNMLFKASDFMKAEIEKVENDESLTEDISEITDNIEKVLNLISGAEEKAQGEEAGAAEGEASTSEGLDEEHKYAIRVFFDEGLGMENLRAFMIVNSIREVCEDFVVYPKEIESDNTTSNYIIDHGFVVGMKSSHDQELALDIVSTSVNVRTYESFVADLSGEKAEEKPKAAESEKSQAESQPQQAAPVQEKNEIPAAAEDDKKKEVHKEKNKASGGSKQSLISVNLSKLDALVDIVGEIVITESMVTSCPDLVGFKSDSFTSAARQLRKLTDELQDTAMSIRMVPVSSTFQKMTRIVRDMSQKLNKKARLVTVGADTEVDKTIVDSIGDPIMHMVRNSMDHGIETDAQDRINAGKDPEGTITLSAQHTGSEVIITISDDGKGVNSEAVLAKAKKNGLLTKPESEYSRKEILNMLLLPGFSMKKEVTEFSGRGVGMDVVKKNIEKVGGTITITSEEGEGMTTVFKIPLTLAIVDGMLINVGDITFTIPIANIKSSFKITEEDIIYDEKRGEMLQKEDNFYPLVRLHEYYDIETEVQDVSEGIVMWLEADEKTFCLFVDNLIGEQQIVVKPLPEYLNDFDVKNYGVSGCTVIGDGNISIIIDPLSLYNATVNSAF
ncbi:MAG: chemotaxis protein CheA [Firmicutes bacterium]|nr:chemotaxis protein CheA [Bacillota bacterium]